MEFFVFWLFSVKSPHPTRPLMRNVKGLLTRSFHQPKVLPAPCAQVNFHLVVQLPHLAPLAAADGAQTHRPPLPPAPGRLRPPPCSSSGPWPPLSAATRMLLHTGWGLVWIRSGRGRAHSPSLHPTGLGRSEMEAASFPQLSACSDGAQSAPPVSPQ